MYRLRILSGPNQGAVFPLKSGETKIGRSTDNDIQLPSNQVSKRHCVITILSGELFIRDEASANGTYLNGAQTRESPLRPGDRIKVGEYQFELMSLKSSAQRDLRLQQGASSMDASVEFQQSFSVGIPGAMGAPGELVTPANQNGAPQVPDDLKGRFNHWLDYRLLPKIYTLNQQYEWSTLGIIALALFLFLNLGFTVFPLIERSSDLMVKELGRRAQSMARQMSKSNVQALISGNESQLDVGIFDQEPGVRSALILDLDSRILAPSAKLNQYLNSKEEGVIAAKAAKQYRTGKESSIIQRVGDETVVAVEPILGYRPDLAKNVVLGMAVVSMDVYSAIPDMGEMSVVYAEVLIYTALFGLILAYLFYRLTLRPLQKLNDEIDEVLKGSRQRVSQEYRWKELTALWEVINSALQRIPRNESSSLGGMSSEESSEGRVPQTEELLSIVKSLSGLSGIATALFDGEKRVVFLNSAFEEITGIRNDSSIGQDISQLARDQAFGSLLIDFFDRISGSPEGLQEDFEFSGITYKVIVSAAINGTTLKPWGVVLVMARLG